jgi:heme-degrading monooxygenase HmoA
MLINNKYLEVMMSNMLVHHNVEDYNKWKNIFDEHSPFRAQMGSKGGRVFRSANDPNDLFILFEWDNLENAKKFTQSDNLKQTMQKAGVKGTPDIYFLEETASTET